MNDETTPKAEPAPESVPAPAEPASPGPAQKPVELSAYQRRKERERERERKREATKAKRAEREATKPKESAAKEGDGEPARADENRARDAAVFLRGLFRVASLFAFLFGYRVVPLTRDEAREDAGSWVPLARRYRWFDLAITWAGAPVSLVERLGAHLERRADVPTKPTAPGKERAA